MVILDVPDFLKARGIKRIVGLDFETFFSTHYTLKKMSTSLYIYDEQFKAHGVGIDAQYITKNIKENLNTIDWDSTALLCHHTQFDGLILSYHFNIHPKYYMCSMSMARPFYKNTIGAGLDKVSKALGHAGKTSDILERTKGIRDLDPEQDEEMGEYCLQDVNEMKLIFQDLLPLTTEQEMDIIDMTIRMYADPYFECDIPRITQEVQTQTANRVMTMKKSNLVPRLRGEELKAHCRLNDIKYKEGETYFDMIEKVLRSAPKFAAELEKQNVEVPMKISKTTGKQTYAFAKTDIDFLALERHDNSIVQDLFRARMAAKSTTALDKAIKLLNMSKYGPIPCYLNYWPTQTGRWSGGDKIQLQNMPRGGEMRRSLIAPRYPRGFKIPSGRLNNYYLTVYDSSGIEMRMLAWFSDNQDMLDMIARGIDVYKDMASQIYSIAYDKVSKAQRFIGKIAILGLGYGCGAAKFQLILESGAMGPPVKISLQEAQRVVDMYRKKANTKVPELWRTAERWLEVMLTGTREKPKHYKGLTFREGAVDLPDGTTLQYPDMRGQYNMARDNYSDFSYQGPNGLRKYIYGGLFVENLTQALARSVVAEQLLAGSHKYKLLLAVHDEGVFLTPKYKFWEAEQFLHKCFITQPKWCLDLPLGAEGGSAREYSK